MTDIDTQNQATLPEGWTELDARAVDTVRVLAADAVQKVGNGHPGTAMSLAPVAYLLFQKVMQHDPADAHWPGRDRFVLSCGHTSLTLYIQLYLGGFGLELDDIKALRTWNSKTPGHPEYGHTKGVEITTGPLGQGVANAVGMAMAARRERGLLDPDAAPGQSPFDHQIYCLASDGDIEEGISSEASSLAGTQRWQPDPDLRQEPHLHRGRHQHRPQRGHRGPLPGVRVARPGARLDQRRHHVRRGRRRAGSSAPGGARGHRPAQLHQPAHDHRLAGAEQAEHRQGAWLCAGCRRGRGDQGGAGLRSGADLEVSDEVLAHTRKLLDRGREARAAWQSSFDAWAEANPQAKELYDRMVNDELTPGWEDALPSWPADPKGIATRAASGKVLNALAPKLPELWGGSADLAESNNTTMEGEPSFLPTDRQSKMFPGQPYGRVLHFGIREHAMGAILNGIKVHGGTRPYGGTFLTFSDYMRAAVRLSALMRVPVIYVWTHDSIGLGEDGPTHQPIEHLAALRAIPGLDIVRPADANETAACWAQVLKNTDRPAA